MITSIAQLLTEFQQKEAEILDRKTIVHAPTIGAMYEGLTREMLDRGIPSSLDLRVCSGFVTSEDGHLSKQIDCMLVKGEGELIPYTEDYVYDVRNVIAIVEVKKNLYAGELSSAYNNLLSVKRMRSPETYNFRLFKDAYKAITRTYPPRYEDLSRLPISLIYIYHALTAEIIAPLRIVIGYHGFATEQGLRDAFLDYLASQHEKQGSGPASFPNLIISGTHSLVKLNAMPYSIPVNSNLWPVYASYTGNHVKLLLEIIWTRLVYCYGLSPSVFGDDLELEMLRPLLLVEARKYGEKVAWYSEESPITKEKLDRMVLRQDWIPAVISPISGTILTMLTRKEELSLDDQNLRDYIAQEGRAFDEVVQELYLTGFVSIQGDKLLLLSSVKIVFTPDGMVVVAEANDQRLNKWLEKRQFKHS